VLTELEARTHIAGLRSNLVTAINAINEQSADLFEQEISGMRESLLSGRLEGNEAATTFRSAFDLRIPEREADTEGFEAAGPAMNIHDVRLLPRIVCDLNTILQK
jgi:hypothetical protein